MSIDTGVKRGFQYMADYIRCIEQAAATAVKHPEQAAHLLAACAKPAKDWIGEAAAVKGIDAGGNITNALLFAVVISDPFEGSRHDVQALKAELGIK